MNPAKSAALKAKNFFTAHKLPITVVATATATAVVAKRMYGTAYAVATEFIAQEGLTEKFNEFVPDKTI